MLAQTLKSSAPKQSATPSLSQDSAPLPALAPNQAQAPQQKKSLNDMAKLESQESFLSKITQNASKAESSSQPKASGTNAQVESSAPSVKGASAKLDSSGANDTAPESNAIQQALQASALVAGAQEAAQSLSPAKPSAPSTPAAPAAPASAPLQDGTPKAPPTNALAKPTLGDVVQKAQDLGLNPSKAEFTQQEEEFKNSVQARTGMRQAPASEGIKQFFDKQDEVSLRPFFSMLSAANALDAAARRSSKANRIEYAIESKTEKIAIINRGKILPKNITESRIKNERQEKVFEQIQKDIIAGKELDLEQIKAELFASKSESPKPLAQPTSPSQPAQRLASTAAIAAPALVQGAQEALRESQKSSKDPREQAPHGKKTSANTQGSQKVDSSSQKVDSSPLRAELESSTPKELARAMESELELADMELPKELERAQEKSPKSAKQAEQKTESKLESKLATSAALGASAMKQELSKPQVREMITSFVNQFDQEVKKFKPPMNKISLELNPKELGNIELTIAQRGNNLHISVVSNPQAITLFAQNQLDLRQSLIAQGFDGIDLSFSQNSSGGFGSGSQNGNQSGENPQGLGSNGDSNGDYALKDSSEPRMDITLPLYA